MKNIKLELQYDGTAFLGFQKQNEGRTIQGELENALSSFMGEKIEIVCAGRTDKGVHAIHQVINFKTSSPIPVDRFVIALNKRVPEDIRIISAKEEETDFNSRFSAKGRRYLYKMKPMQGYNVYERNHITFIEDKIDTKKFLEIVGAVKGKHDFESFRKTDCMAKSSIREIFELNLEEVGDEYHFYIRGNAFLKSMVRIIVGSALAVYFGKRPPDYIKQRLENPDKNAEKLLAPPNGLYLYKVEY